MQSLTQIIGVLKPGEVRLIRNYYKVQSNGEVQKRLTLFDLIRSGKVGSDQEAAAAIYDSAPSSAYSHLKARLQKDILSLLLLQEGSKRYETKYAQAIFDCRRMIIEGQMLIERGAYNMGVEVLTKAAALADKYEFYLEDVTINDILRTHLGVKKGIKAYNKYDKEIRQKVEKMEKLLQAKDYYHRMLVPNLFQKNREQHYSDFSKEALETLEAYYKQTKSANIGYFYYYISIYYHQIHKNMDAALQSAQNFLKLIEKHPAIHSSSRVASANFQIAVNMAYMQRYKEAMRYAEVASNKFVKGLINELAALEMLFYAALHNGDFAMCQQVLNRARAHPKIHVNKQYPAKWDYYEANLLFCMGKYEEASAKLIGYSELLKDKAGWLLGHKMLELMCMFMQDELDLMDFRTESLRKLLQRQKGENVQRSKAMMKVLETYMRLGGNLKKTREKEADRLQLLRDAEGAYSWDPLGFELVRFDAWFDNLKA